MEVTILSDLMHAMVEDQYLEHLGEVLVQQEVLEVLESQED